MIKKQHFDITLAWDRANAVWFVEQSDLPGLCVEAPTLDAMRDIIHDLAPDLLETNVPVKQRDWPLHIQHVMEPRRNRAA